MSQTELASRLARQIREHGPIRLSAFMESAISLYYANAAPFGRQGDFVTAPEISQMFGEIIGLWAAVLWQGMGMPNPLLLVELGPGRGFLMQDVLRAAQSLPGFAAALQLHLVETSESLRAVQRATLADQDIIWHSDVAALPEGPMILIANEFFDALPIDQFILRHEGWCPRLVAADKDGFCFVDGPAIAEARVIELGFPQAQQGEIFEICEAGRALAAALGERFARHPGIALIIDYGHAVSAPGDTLQAISHHRMVPALERPGEVDLTAHVDFQALAERAGCAQASAVVTQSLFLRRLGIELRATRLAAARPEQAARIQADCQRLIDPNDMGGLFKMMAVTSPGFSGLPGFAA